MGWGWGRRGWGMGGMGMGGGGFGCSSIIMVIVLLVFVVTIFSMIPGMGGGLVRTDVTRSTVARTALPRGYAGDVGPWFTDNMNPAWIGSAARMERGMRNFFDRTGVRPHLYLTGDLNGNTAAPSIEALRDYAGQAYERLFNDEAHVLLLFFENAQGQYGMYVMPGGQARMVMDDEAREILMDYVQRYYYSNIDTEEMFSRVFDGASTRIMTVTRSPWINVIIIFGLLLILFLLFTWWKRKQAQKNIEAEQTERILNQSLDTFGTDDEASRLAQQYNDDEDK